jgi:hypothetical protein
MTKKKTPAERAISNGHHWQDRQEEIIKLIRARMSLPLMAEHFGTEVVTVRRAIQRYDLRRRATNYEISKVEKARRAEGDAKASARLKELMDEYTAMNAAHKAAHKAKQGGGRSATFEDELQAVANGRGIHVRPVHPGRPDFPFSLTGDGGFGDVG